VRLLITLVSSHTNQMITDDSRSVIYADHVEAADNLHVLPSLSSPVWDRSERLVRVDVEVSDKNLVSLIASRYKGGYFL